MKVSWNTSSLICQGFSNRKGWKREPWYWPLPKSGTVFLGLFLSQVGFEVRPWNFRFTVDSETADPIDVEPKKCFETNSMVEEFMLAANISAAKRIYLDFPDCAMLRRHPAPPPSNFDPLVDWPFNYGTRPTENNCDFFLRLKQASNRVSPFQSIATNPSRTPLIRLLTRTTLTSIPC